MLQTMDGAVQTISTILDRMKELATQANSANVGDQRDKLDLEFQSLTSEIGRITATTKYQGTSLINGDFGTKVDTAVGTSTVLAKTTGVIGASLNGAAAGTYAVSEAAGAITMTSNGVSQTITGAANSTLNFDKLGVSLELGAAYASGTAVAGDLVVTAGSSTAAFQVSSSGSYGGDDQISIDAVNLTTGADGLDLTGLDLSTAAGAQTALGKLDTAMETISTALGKIGSAQSRFDFACQQRGDHPAEHAGGRVDDPRRRHGDGDEPVHEEQHPVAGRAGDALAGEPGLAGHPAAPALIATAPAR
jgi:flagellin